MLCWGGEVEWTQLFVWINVQRWWRLIEIETGSITNPLLNGGKETET
jgi:hypothetical protein